jgi:hypothetical protein
MLKRSTVRFTDYELGIKLHRLCDEALAEEAIPC